MLMYTSCGWFFDELSGHRDRAGDPVRRPRAPTRPGAWRPGSREPVPGAARARQEQLPRASATAASSYEKFVRPAMVDLEEGRRPLRHQLALRELAAEAAGSTATPSIAATTALLTAGKARLALGRARITPRSRGNPPAELSACVTWAITTSAAAFALCGRGSLRSRGAGDRRDVFRQRRFPGADPRRGPRVRPGTYSLNTAVPRRAAQGRCGRSWNPSLGDAEAAYRQIYQQSRLPNALPGKHGHARAKGPGDGRRGRPQHRPAAGVRREDLDGPHRRARG